VNGAAGWVIGAAVTIGVLVASWATLFVLARRLPPGPLRELAQVVPHAVTTVRRLRRDPRVPRRAKLAVVLAGLWLLSPIDLVPEFLPVIGPLDDVVVVALALRYAARCVPRDTLLEAWPGDPRLLERLIGRGRSRRPRRRRLTGTGRGGRTSRSRGEPSSRGWRGPAAAAVAVRTGRGSPPP